MKRHKLLRVMVLLPLLLMLGCASKVVILLDGRPVPEYSYTMTNPATGLSMEVVAANYIKTYETGELVLWPTYFSVGETYYVDPDNTSYVKITVRIRNPNKVWYELKENVFSKQLFGKGKSKASTEGIYKGRLRFNKFEIHHFVKNNTMRKINVEVMDKDKTPLFIIGDFSYKVVRPDSEDNENLSRS